MAPIILLVEDDEPLREAIEGLLTNSGYRVETARNGKFAIEKLKAKPIDLVLTDLVMPEKDGIELILEMRKEFGAIPVIAFSAYGKSAPGNYLQIAERFGVRAVLEKPFTSDQLLRAVRSVLGAGSSSPRANIRTLWGSLARGMTKEEVVQILGQPLNITQGSWIYPNGGSVSFDQENKVSAIYAL